MEYKLDEFGINGEVLVKFIKSKFLLYFVVLLFILKICSAAVFINFPQNIFFADITKSSLENFVNQTRQSLGVGALTESEELNAAAQMKAEDMAQNEYFAHTSPSGVTPWTWFLKAGYNYKYAGENLAIGFFESEEVFQAWLNSPSHRDNLINPNYKEIGTAVLKGYGDGGAIIVVQLFGAEKQPAVAVAPVKPVVQKPEVQAPAVINEPQATAIVNEPEVALEPVVENTSSLPETKVLNLLVDNMNGVVQDVTFATSLIVMAGIISILLFGFQEKPKPQFIFRSLVLLAMLFTTLLLDKNILISLIPHNILI